MDALTDDQKRTGLTSLQAKALERLAAPKTLDSSLSLTFSRPELTNVGQAFVELVKMGYARRKKVAGG